jgi:D-alanyl-D-alanine carboxypeptidase
VEGLGNITARIAQINQQITALSPKPATTQGTGTTSGTTASGRTFATELAGAMRSASTTGTTGVKLTKDGVPADLVHYGNGKIPANALESIGRGGHRLWSPAADAFKAMTAAARQDGVTIGVTDSYRSYDQQVDLARRKGLYSQGGLAAKPGTSEHGWGLSLDLDLNSKAQAWMRKHADEYGFKENVPREPWHWTFKPSG